MARITHQKPAPRISKAIERLIKQIDDLTWTTKYRSKLMLEVDRSFQNKLIRRIARLEADRRELRRLKKELNK